MWEFVSRLWDVSDFPARWYCGNWSGLLGWAHVVSDLVVFVCYMLIPLTILYVMRRRGPDVPFPKLLVLFCTFILSCGLVHLVEAIIFWHPLYRFSALLKVGTALASLATVMALLPKASTLLSMRTLRELELEIEQRKLAEADLEAARQMLEARVMAKDKMLEDIFSVSIDMLCTATPEHFLEVNPAFERTLGFRREEFLSRPILSFVHPDDVEETQDMAARVQRGEDVLDFINRYRHQDGTWRWLSWKAKPINPEYNVSTARDITDQRNYERALERKNESLRHFAYAVSHDLKEPLRTLSTFSELLLERRDEFDKDACRHLTFIHEGGVRTEEMLDGLLKFTQNELHEIEYTTVHLNDVFVLVRAHLLVLLEETQAQVSIPKDLPHVYGSEMQLVQVFQNLLSNALKFTPNGEVPRVEVTWSVAEGHIHVQVRDHGIGIPQEHIGKIFGAFQRLHQRGEYPGNGIGLALAKQIVNHHNGTVQVRSTCGEGTTFEVSLPQRI